MVAPLWGFGLTPEQGLKIATILANWAMVDNEISHLLQRVSGITDDRDGADLVHVIDLRKKIEILNERRKQNRLAPQLNDLVSELIWVSSNYRSDRNMLAHGIMNVNNTHGTAYSSSKRRTLDLTLLDNVLDESHYATWVAHNLFLTHLGVTPDPLPSRPPARPASP